MGNLKSLVRALFSPLFACSLLVGCGAPDRETTSSGTFADESEAVEEAKAESVEHLGSDGSKLRALWDKRSIAKGWNALVLKEVNAKRAAFESAQDLEEFCPGYKESSAFQKDSCWLRLVSAMARYGSNFVPTATYKEDTGGTSVGLLMMNPEHCPSANTIEKLQKVPPNISCALQRMSLLVARDKYISGPTVSRGAGAYWSVLRAPYKYKKLFLGRRTQILEFTRTYAGFSDRVVRTDSESVMVAQTFP